MKIYLEKEVPYFVSGTHDTGVYNEIWNRFYPSKWGQTSFYEITCEVLWGDGPFGLSNHWWPSVIDGL